MKQQVISRNAETDSEVRGVRLLQTQGKVLNEITGIDQQAIDMDMHKSLAWLVIFAFENNAAPFRKK